MEKNINNENLRPGFVYAAYQDFDNLYNLSDALKYGTMFKELNIPFEEYSNNPIMNPFK